ncbi:hypothetical protein Tco_1153672 [Tanacetum coccineum]
MPYPRFTKIIINYFLSQHKSLAKKKHSYINTIKDDGVLNRLKFVKTGEDFQEYGRAIPDTMLTDNIKESEAYKDFIGYSTGSIPPKKTRGKGSKGKNQAVTPKKKGSITAADNKLASEEESDESDGEPASRPTGNTMQAIKASRKVNKNQPYTRDSSEGVGITPDVPDESAGIFTTSSEGTSITPGVPDEVKGSVAAKTDIAIYWGSENKSDQSDETQVNEEEIEWVSIDEEEEQQDDHDDDDDRSIDIEETDDDEKTDDEKDDDEMTDAAKADAEKIEEVKGDNKQAGIKVSNVDQTKDTSAQDNQATVLVSVKLKEMPELPPTISSLSVSSGFDVPQIQSPTLFNVPISIIPEQPVPAPSPTLTIKTPVSTVLYHPPPITAISSVLQQSTPIPTPPITTVALSVTTVILDPLPAIVQRLSDLENQFEEWKRVDHYEDVEDSVQSYLTQDKHQKLYDSLLNSIMLDESIAKGDVNPDKVLKKRDCGDNEDKDPSTGPNQGKKTKRRRTKESESSKKSHLKDNTANDDVINDADQP